MTKKTSTGIGNAASDKDTQAHSQCERARHFERVGDYEAARREMEGLWHRVGERPRVEGLGPEAAADVLLCAAILTGRIGSAHQVEGAQELAKDLASESFTAFDSMEL